MAYTTSALAFMLGNLAKPVVVTGAQLPISFARTDAAQNLAGAIYVAGYKATGLPCIPEVVLCFADKILRGCRATKISTDGWAIFDSPDFPPLGTIGSYIKINTDLLRPPPPPGAKFFIHEEFDSDAMRRAEVLDLGLFPGFRPTQLARMLDSPNLRGVLLRTFGSGNAPTDAEFLETLNAAIHRRSDRPLLVLNVTQCTRGMVEMGRYAASSNLLECGVISGLDMTGEAALAKLYWTLATQPQDRAHTHSQINHAGEQSENLFDLRYGAAGDKNAPMDVFRATVTPDVRLEPSALKRAVVRFLGLGVQFPHADTPTKSNSATDTAPPWNALQARLRLFINKPGADTHTPLNDLHCLGEVLVDYTPDPTTVIYEIPQRAWPLLSKGPIEISFAAQDNVRIWFKGLSLALFTKSAF